MGFESHTRYFHQVAHCQTHFQIINEDQLMQFPPAALNPTGKSSQGLFRLVFCAPEDSSVTIEVD
jgi:hypothetical protein